MQYKDSYTVDPAIIAGNLRVEQGSEDPRYKFSCRFDEMLAILNKSEMEKLYKETGISKSQISKFRRGQAQPGFRDLSTISNYFQVSSDYLLGLADAKALDPSIQSSVRYTHLSETAIMRLRNLAETGDPVLTKVLNYLIAKGHIEHLVKALVNSLVATKQYEIIYGSQDIEDKHSTLKKNELMRYNERARAIYKDVTDTLGPKLESDIKRLSEAQIENLKDAALNTIHDMESLLDHLDGDTIEIDKYLAKRLNKRIQQEEASSKN